MGESVETHFDVKLWCRKAETDTASPLGGQTDHWSCTLKAVLHMPLPCPTPASHLQVQLTITALVEEGMLAQACVLLIHTRTMFYHLSDEMTETGDRAGESQLSFRICHWRPSSGSNMTVCIVARHMGWKSHGTTIHCWGHNSCLRGRWLKVPPEITISGTPTHLYGAWQWIQHSPPVCRLSP